MTFYIPEKHHLPLAYFIMLLGLMYGPVFGSQHYSGASYLKWVSWLLIVWAVWVMAVMAVSWFFNKVDDKKEVE